LLEAALASDTLDSADLGHSCIRRITENDTGALTYHRTESTTIETNFIRSPLRCGSGIVAAVITRMPSVQMFRAKSSVLIDGRNVHTFDIWILRAGIVLDRSARTSSVSGSEYRATGRISVGIDVNEYEVREINRGLVSAEFDSTMTDTRMDLQCFLITNISCPLSLTKLLIAMSEPQKSE